MYYIVKVKYERMGEEKPVNEIYAFKTISFASAEYAALQIVQPKAQGLVEIKSIQRMAVAETFGDIYCIESYTQSFVAKCFGQHELPEEPDTWFKVKASFITIDEKTAKEKRQSFTYLVYANNVEGANNIANQELRKGMADYVIESVTETKIEDVYIIQPSAKKED